MNAHGKPGRAASIVGALATLLLTHSATADDVMIVYGKRIEAPEADDLAKASFDAGGFRVALHDDIRASLRESFLALRVAIAADDAAASEVQVASLAARPDA